MSDVLDTIKAFSSGRSQKLELKKQLSQQRNGQLRLPEIQEGADYGF